MLHPVHETFYSPKLSARTEDKSNIASYLSLKVKNVMEKGENTDKRNVLKAHISRVEKHCISKLISCN